MTKTIHYTTALVLAISLATGITLYAAELSNPNSNAGEQFGKSVAINDNRILVGAPYRNANQGAAYLFDSASGLLLNDSSTTLNEQRGFSVALNSSLAILGLPQGGSSPGTNAPGRVERRDLANFSGNAVALFAGPDSNGYGGVGERPAARFGTSVAVNSNVIAVGAPHRAIRSGFFASTYDNAGAVYLHHVNAAANATPFRTYFAKYGSSGNDNDHNTDENFGFSVALNNAATPQVAVGAPQKRISFDGSGSSASQRDRVGAVFLFDYNSGRGVDGKVERRYLAPNNAQDRGGNDHFGYSVALTNNELLIGAPGTGKEGKAYLYNSRGGATDGNGNAFTPYRKFVPASGHSVSGDRFGTSVAASERYALVGADESAINGATGAAYLFPYELSNQTYQTQHHTVKITRTDRVAADRFGHSVAFNTSNLADDNFVIGAPGVDGNRGRAYAGNASALTTLDGGRTKEISAISFLTRENWIVGSVTSNNKVTLAPSAYAELENAEKAVFIGSQSGANSNTLEVYASNVKASNVYVGSTVGNTGNTLLLNGTANLRDENIQNILLANDNHVVFARAWSHASQIHEFLGTTALYVQNGEGWEQVTPANWISLVRVSLTAQGTMIVTPGTAVLAVSPDSHHAMIAGASFTATVTSNVSWTVSKNADWISLSTTGSLVEGLFTATVAANPTMLTRSGTVTVTGGGLTQEITLVQDAAPATLAISPEGTKTVNAEGETFSVAVASNVVWSVNKNADWLTLSTTNGKDNESFEITVAPYNVIAPRYATVTVTGEGITREITITQTAAAPSLVISPEGDKSVAAAGGSFSVAVTSNVMWNVDKNADWVTLSATDSENNGSFEITVGAYKVVTPRYATVTVTGEGITREIIITQTAAVPSLFISPKKAKTVDEFGETFTVAVASNVDWSATADVPWISLSQADASTLTVIVDRNKDRERLATVNITGGGITRTLAITQETYTLDSLYRKGIYETRISARTSTLREMNVKAFNENTGKIENVKVHYSAPVSKRYTILMAHDGEGDDFHYTSLGYGRMWSNDKEQPVTFGGERLFLSGVQADGVTPSFIGRNGLNIPVEFDYFNAEAPESPWLSFTGIMNFDKKNNRFSGGSGVVYSENMTPARNPKNRAAEQGVLTTSAEEMAFWQLAEHQKTIEGVYYPQPAFSEDGNLAPAHFFGTYTTRFNAALSKKANGDFTEMKNQINKKVPLRP